MKLQQPSTKKATLQPIIFHKIEVFDTRHLLRFPPLLMTVMDQFQVQIYGEDRVPRVIRVFPLIIVHRVRLLILVNEEWCQVVEIWLPLKEQPFDCLLRMSLMNRLLELIARVPEFLLGRFRTNSMIPEKVLFL